MFRIALLGLLLLLTGCSTSHLGQGKKLIEQERYDQAIESFYTEISINPKSSEAWRELGVAYYKKGDMVKAEDALTQARLIMPDARIYLFVGLIQEHHGDYEKAIDAYAASLNLKPDKNTRTILSGHLDRLIYKKIAGEVEQALASESAIDVASIPDNTIAVLNFDGSHLDPELAPIATGLAEFASADLAKVASLNVVERLKVDMILNELKLSQSGYVDPASAPRVGRLVGTSKLVTGSLIGIGDDGFRLDGVIISTTDSTITTTEPTEGTLARLFDIEKKLVFDIIDDLGIQLTKAERDDINEVPTESFLAFLSYSRGLSMQRRGMTEMAALEFQNAIDQDANFGAAKTAVRKAAAGSMATGYQSSFQALETAAITGGGLDMISSELDGRLSNILSNSGLIPGGGGGRGPVSQPRISGTGTVLIRVDFDNANQ